MGYSSGFFCAIFSRFLPPIPILSAGVSTLLASLALVQLSTAWVHIVMTTKSGRHFWQRLPPFKKTFNATARPVLLYWLAYQLCVWVTIALALVLDLELPGVWRPVELGDFDPAEPRDGDAWRATLLAIVTLLWVAFIQLPAQVILIRVQASLLPVEDDTIVPFDRSFQGKVEPLVVGGKGYVGIVDAWKTFSRAAWRRLIILSTKIIVVAVAIYALMIIAIVPQVVMILTNRTTIDIMIMRSASKDPGSN